MPAEEIEPAFDFIENDRGELMLALNARRQSPSDPVLLLHPGGLTAVLRRDPSCHIRLTEIHPAAGPKLETAQEILVAETDGDDILHAYTVPVLKSVS